MHETGVEVRYREVIVAGRPITLIAVPKITRRIVTAPDGRLLRR